MRKLYGTLFALTLACISFDSAFAATYELIPSWSRNDEYPNGNRYIYRAFYIDNLKRVVYLCFATRELEPRAR
jgi:hypothetical protein